MSTLSDIDLGRVPPPEAIEPIDVAAELDALVQRYREVAGDAAAHIDLPSDPIRKFLEEVVFIKALLVARINAGVRACLVATATGADLDNLAALVPLLREDGESDDDFRARIRLAPEGFSTAGSRGAYVAQVLDAHPDVSDVAVFGHVAGQAGADDPAPGEIHVIAIGAEDGTLPVAVRAAVEARIEEVRPLNDDVIVIDPDVIAYTVEATLSVGTGPSPATVLAASRTAVQTYVDERVKLGAEITRASLIAALHVEGVRDVDLASPAANVPVGAREVAVATSVSVELAA